MIKQPFASVMNPSIDLFIDKSGDIWTIHGDITFREAKASAVIHGALPNSLNISKNECPSLKEHGISNTGGKWAIGRQIYCTYLNLGLLSLLMLNEVHASSCLLSKKVNIQH
jgi:hypothetical protein